MTTPKKLNLDSKGRSRQEWMDAFLDSTSVEEVKGLISDLRSVDAARLKHVIDPFMEGVGIMMGRGLNEAEAVRFCAINTVGDKAMGYVWRVAREEED